MKEAGGDLFALHYRELRQLAERQLRRNSGASVSATPLLHEAYFNLAGSKAEFPDKSRFLGYTARVMRCLIIDMLRERRAVKRGAEFHLTQIPEDLRQPEAALGELSDISEALDELALRDAALAELVDLRYFCGYTFDEIAAQRGTSKRTLQRDWEKARVLLYDKLKNSNDI